MIVQLSIEPGGKILEKKRRPGKREAKQVAPDPKRRFLCRKRNTLMTVR